MHELRNHFIISTRPWSEGAVDVLEQKLAGGIIKSATLTITALGVYEARLNGTKVGDQVFTPGFTYYPRDLHVQRYDVTNMLQAADNTLRVYLGQGWYCGRFTHKNLTKIYGGHSAVAWMLAAEYADGSTRTYASSGIARDNAQPGVGEVALLESPYDYAGFYDGEVYYAEGAERDGKAFAYVPSAKYSPQKYEGALPDTLEERDVLGKFHEEVTVKTAIRRGDVTILDFGQNFAGVIEIDPVRMDGAVLKLRHGELLNADGSLYTANLRKAKAELIYHKGGETSKYRPRFTYMGFRYAELSGVEYREGLLTAYALYDDMERTGRFQCENPLVQRLYDNQVWGQKSNYIEVPTDCPQRDERQGYTGDGHVYALTGSYNFDTERFWDKFLKDIRYTQMDNSEGYVAPTIPANGPAGIGMLTMLGWGNAVTILPELLFWQYGTERYLQTQYDSMKLFVECEMRKMEGTDLWLAPSLGDWLMPGNDVAFAVARHGPVSNAFIVNDLRILSETAARFGHREDAARYAGQLERTRQAYIDTFVAPDGRMNDDYQGAYIMALRFVLPKGELRDRVFVNLVGDIREHGMQTGFFATEHLLPLLAENGEARLAYTLLLQENCPGWIYQVKLGATTTWERWDAIQPDGSVNESKMSEDNMVSFNHYAFGSVGEFYYRHILGIQPLEPGFAKVRIRPIVDGRLGEVSGAYKSRSGRIAVAWRVQGGTVRVRVETPVATELYLPDGTVRELSAGKHEAESILPV